MTNPEIEKGIDMRETGLEKPPETPEAERLPDVLEMRQELDTETYAGLETGHDTLATLATQEQASTEYPPELKTQFAEIQKEAASKLGRLDATLGRMKERFLSVANFLTGGMFERGRTSPTESNKFFKGFHVGEKLSIEPEERERLEAQIDMESVKEKAGDANEYLAGKIKENDVVLLGELHSHSAIEKRAVANFLQQAKTAGTTHVGIEISEYWQEAVDRYMETGKFDENDDPADYERTDEYLKLYNEQLDADLDPQDGVLYNFEGDMWKQSVVKTDEKVTDKMFAFQRENVFRNNFLFKNRLYKNFHLLSGIREAGLSPVCLDANTSYKTSQRLDEASDRRDSGEITLIDYNKMQEEEESRRDIRMAQITQQVVEGGGKMLAVLGNAHVAREGFRNEPEARPNMADILSDTDIKTSSINLDRDCDSDSQLSYYRREAEANMAESCNSILFSAIGKEPTLADRSVGFDLEPSMVGQTESAPYDGYIRLNGSI